MTASITRDDIVTINGSRPIEGSVSIEQDDSEVSVIQYMDSKSVIVKGQVKYTLKWQVYGKGEDEIKYSEVKLQLGESGTGESIAIRGLYKSTHTWNADWGFVQDFEITGYLEG